jgi:type III secretion protein J
MISKSLTRVFAVMALIALSACGDNLYNGLTERDANEMVAVLLDAQVPATRVAGENGHYSIRIDKSSFSTAVKLLSNAGYPRDSFKSIDDVFPGGKLIQSPLEQRARFAFALSQDLSRSVSALRGISFARVHIALAQFDLRGTVVSPASASVIIRYGESAELTEIVAQTREIVASGVEGLAPENVKIILTSQDDKGAPSQGDNSAAASSRKSLSQTAAQR